MWLEGVALWCLGACRWPKTLREAPMEGKGGGGRPPPSSSRSSCRREVVCVALSLSLSLCCACDRHQTSTICHLQGLGPGLTAGETPKNVNDTTNSSPTLTRDSFYPQTHTLLSVLENLCAGRLDLFVDLAAFLRY